ncbi:MAG: PDZ domain-containing protein [Planctomycetota bacterium]|nr:PDZ domain-containing protein [Planctomycetota bacterium]
MKTMWMVLGSMAAALLLAASAASAGQGAASAAGRVTVSVDESGVKPEIHIWINGKEVKPGDAIDLGGLRIEGGADLKDMRAEPGERGSPGAYLGVMVGPAEGKAGGETAVRIDSVMPESPAAQAGLAEGDVIVSLDGTQITGPQQFVDLVRGHKPGDRLTLKCARDGKKVEKQVTLAAWPERRPGLPRRAEGPERESSAEAYMGVIAAPLTEDIKKLAGTDRGVLINSLQDNSPAAQAGLLPGDVITAVDGKEVAAPGDLGDRIRGRKPGDTVRIDYYRSGKKREVEVKLGQRPAEEHGRPGGRFFETPEGLGEQVPELRNYMDQLRRWLEEGSAHRGGSGGPFPGPGPNMPAPSPEMPQYPQRPHAMPVPPEAPRLHAEPYDVGKDIGKILQRLDQIDKRLGDIERRLDRIEKKPNRE